MKRLVIVFVVLGFVAFAGMAMAAEDTESINVTATVSAACSISSVSNVAFGAYDPTLGTPDDDGTGSITFACVKGTSYKTFIAGTRTMTDGGTNTLAFELYSDSGRTTVFPSDNSGSGTAATSITPVTTDIYGRIAAGLDAAAASYSVALTATVEY